MRKILKEFNLTNSTNDKLEVMRKYKDDSLVIEVFQKALDKVKWTYGVTLKNVIAPTTFKNEIYLRDALKRLERLADRSITGNSAIVEVQNILQELNEDDAYVIERIIDRDLKINFGKTGFNKIISKENKIIKPPYMRCGLYSEKSAKKISFPAIVQLKADGAFQAVTVDQGKVTFMARSGEEREFPHLEIYFKNLNDGVYIGELLVHGISDRSLANGVINSDGSKEDVYIQLWDYISLDEYSRGKDKHNKTKYTKRLKSLTDIITNFKKSYPEYDLGGSVIKLIPSFEVDTIQEALEYTSQWMTEGFEGSILKDQNNIFLDHTSPTQLKLKLQIDAEVRITGFTAGKIGTKREFTFGAITFENDEGTIKGQTSGFSDDQILEFHNNREKYTGMVMTVQFNDLTQARGNDYYALSHPRFIEVRHDKDTTDTLERVQESKEMAMTLGA